MDWVGEATSLFSLILRLRPPLAVFDGLCVCFHSPPPRDFGRTHTSVLMSIIKMYIYILENVKVHKAEGRMSPRVFGISFNKDPLSHLSFVGVPPVSCLPQLVLLQVPRASFPREGCNMHLLKVKDSFKNNHNAIIIPKT